MKVNFYLFGSVLSNLPHQASPSYTETNHDLCLQVPLTRISTIYNHYV